MRLRVSSCSYMYMSVPSDDVVGLRLMSRGRWTWMHVPSRGAHLPGASPRPLPGDDDSAFEDLAAPDAPWLSAVQCAGEAGVPDRAVAAQALGLLEVFRALGEPQLRVRPPARQGAPDRRGGQWGGSPRRGTLGPGEPGSAGGPPGVPGPG